MQVETVKIIFNDHKPITYSTDYQKGEDYINGNYITDINVDSLTDTKQAVFYGRVKQLHGETTTTIHTYSTEITSTVKTVKEIQVIGGEW